MWSIWLHLAPSADIIPEFEIGEQLTPAIEPDKIAEIVNKLKEKYPAYTFYIIQDTDFSD